MFLLRLLLPFKKKLLIIYDLAVNGVGFDFYIFMENALQLKKKVGLKEKEVIKIMRSNLKKKSYVLWRKRVRGRITKHRKLFKLKIIGY